MPKLAAFFMIFVLSSVGLPGTSGFVGELYSLIGIYKYSFELSAVAALALVFGAIYMLRLYRDVMLGEIKFEKIRKFSDITSIEYMCFLPLVILTFILGIFPGLVTEYYIKDVISLLSKIGFVV